MKNNEKKLKKLALLTILAIMILSLWFLTVLTKNARMETNLDEYMPSGHPAFIYSDQAEEWFNIKDGILIAIENKAGIYNPQTLGKIRDITEALEDMEEFGTNDIMSLWSADNITGDEWGLDVRPFYTRVPTNHELMVQLRQNVRDNDMVYRRLVSEDETVALIVAGMDSEFFTQDFYSEIMDFAHSFESENENIYVAGRPIVEGTMALLGPQDMKKMVPIVLVVIAVVLYFLLRSFRAAGATLLSVFISSVWAFGLMAVLNVPIYSVSTMIPVMLIAIGVAYGIYFYNHLNRYYLNNPGTSRHEAIFYTLGILWKPLAMAAFTTIIGFISLLTSQVYPIKYFGVFTAFGIFSAFILALVFLPSTVMLLGYTPREKNLKTGGIFNNKRLILMADKMLEKKSRVYIAVAMVILVSLFGVQRVWINSSFLNNFDKESDIVQTDAFVNSKFGGTSTLNVILESETADAFKQPEYLRLMASMQDETEKLDKVGNSFSLADYLKRMNKVMNEDRDEYYTIPGGSDMVAQYLLLYEMSGDPENLLKVVNYDYNRTNVTFQLKGDDSKTINEALSVIKSFENRFSEHGITLNYAGSGYKALVFTSLILEGQLLSIGITLILVLILLSLMFRSIKAGLIGAVPITLTALISFGVMGLLNIPLSTTTALLSSIAIGIGIDYAIHFIQNYRMNIAKAGCRQDAIHATMGQTGKAILFNAIVVIAGFLVLLFSVFPPNRTLGALVSMNMFTSLLGTLSIMMILIYTYRVFSGRGSKLLANNRAKSDSDDFYKLKMRRILK
jgi:uncharacterized protein